MTMEDWEIMEMEEYLEDVFSTPQKLNKFLDDTNFDFYHDVPREEYFPMLRKEQNETP
jgi:hypothetical protein